MVQSWQMRNTSRNMRSSAPAEQKTASNWAKFNMSTAYVKSCPGKKEWPVSETVRSFSRKAIVRVNSKEGSKSKTDKRKGTGYITKAMPVDC